MNKKTMYDYVKEANSIASFHIKNSRALVEPLLQVIPKEVENVWLIASGSSYNACQCARPFMRQCFSKEIKVVTPYTFTYYEHDISQNDIVLVVSQSGLSTNAIEAIQKVKQLGYKAIALTGNVDSDIKDYADIVIDYGVGEELVGYVTKGVTMLSLFLMIFACYATKHLEYLKDLEVAISLQPQMEEKTMTFIKEHYQSLSSMFQSYFVGANASFGVALEGALKVGETVHIPSNTYEIEEYIHGPNLQLTPKYTVFIFDNGDEASDRVQQIYEATKKVTPHVFLIGQNILKTDKNILSIEGNIAPTCVPLVYLPFVQLISYQISSDLKSVYQHPLLKDFKKIASAKTNSFVNYDGDD